MTDIPEANAEHEGTAPEVVDGHSIEVLSDYLDRGRLPRDASIESSPSAQNALAALSRLRSVAPRVLAADAEAGEFVPRNDHWVKRILDQISVQAHAGRNIPISHAVDGAELSISEGAVREIVRGIGDSMEGLVVERCRLTGDVETAGAPIEVDVEVSTFNGVELGATSKEFRRKVEEAVALHVDLNVTAVTVRVRDTDLTEEEGRAK